MSKEKDTNPTPKEKKIDLSAMSREQLEQEVLRLTTSLEESTMKLSWYEEQLRRGRQQKFGASSEKTPDAAQVSFFNEAEAEAALAGEEPALEEIRDTEIRRKKSVGKKAQMTEGLPTVVIHYTLSEDEQVCPQCEGDLHEMKTVVRRELTIIPARIDVIERIQHVYTCRSCEKEDTKTPVVYAPMPAPVLANSVASASLIAHVMSKKYVEAVPLYRQEQQLQRYGYDLSRQTMSNWVVRSSDLWLRPLYLKMKEELVRKDVLHADETPLEVIHDPGKDGTASSYMWVYRTGNVGQNIVLYEYTPGRSGKNPEAFLEGFRGYLHTDGYAGYHRLKRTDDQGEDVVTLLGCWAHMRRKFNDALQGIKPGSTVSHSLAKVGFEYCNSLFTLERKWAKLSSEERLEKRRTEAKTVLDEYFDWIRQHGSVVLPKSLLGIAFGYAANQEKHLRNYILDGRLEISNNRAERAVKPFVIGRKNWLFANTSAGANASAVIYSIVETAKENGLIPSAYLEYLLEEIPNLDRNTKTIADMLPWSDSLPQKCRSKYKPK